jgi:mRNA interferase RelE/StbE
MEIIYKKQFLKDLERFPPKVQANVKLTLDKLYAAESLEAAQVDYARMEGQAGGQNYFRVRIGGFRMGLEYVDGRIIVMLIASRGDVYKKFPPR